MESTFDKAEGSVLKKVKDTVVLNATFENKVMNSTFDQENKEVKNSTFEKKTPEKVLNSTFDNKEAKNSTFEVVGNGSFIVEGKATNLMDTESKELKTILNSTIDLPSGPKKVISNVSLHPYFFLLNDLLYNWDFF